ncbi:MAG TPA: L,D-transpeptidase, partial [Gemmatimonadaceae bacterium]
MRRSLYLILTTLSAGLLSQTNAGARGFHASPLRIVLNIPAVRLDAFVADSLVRTIPIAVGMPAFKSPRGE